MHQPRSHLQSCKDRGGAVTLVFVSKAGQCATVGRRLRKKIRFKQTETRGWAASHVCKRSELVHRVISREHTAVGQLADFQGGPSRTGGNDEHISIDT